MRKSIFLTMIVALFASAGAFTQDLIGTLSCPTPRAIECLTSDALHPVAGTEYTYNVNVPSPDGNKTYRWFVTQETSFINNGTLNTNNIELEGGNLLLDTGTGYNDDANTSSSINLTWKSFNYDPNSPVFVVIKVVNTPTDGSCATDNLKVYKIEPKNAFTLDITNLNVDGSVLDYGATNSSCVSGIESAVYSTTTEEMEYDYGVNYVYYSVTAANFTESWLPSFQLSGLTASQTASVDWSYDGTAGSWNATTPATNGNGTYTSTTNVDAKATGGAVSATGECIVVRVTVDHNKEELLTNQDIVLAVDGKTNLDATNAADQLPDVHYTGTAGDGSCGEADGFTNDTATHTIKARPTVNSDTPIDGGTGDFIPGK